MEQQLVNQLTATSAFLDKRSQDRENAFRDELRNFMAEFKSANDAQSVHYNEVTTIMDTPEAPSFIEHEVIFTPDQHSNATLEGQNDLSFESHHD
jgi:hypothetical protein